MLEPDGFQRFQDPAVLDVLGQLIQEQEVVDGGLA